MRAVERAVVVLLACALLAGGVLAIVEVAVAALDREPLLLPLSAWADAIERNDDWGVGGPRTTSLVLVGSGVALLLLALWPRRPDLLPLAGASAERSAAITRSGLEALMAEELRRDEQVRSASVRIGRGRTTAQVGVVAGVETGAARERLAGRLRHVAEVNHVDGEQRVVVDVSAADEPRVR